MKKNIEKIIIALLVLLLLIVGTILLKLPAKTDKASVELSTTSAPVYTIYEEVAENVKSVVVAAGNFHVEGTRLNDGTWTVNNLLDSDIDKSKAKAFAESAIRITASAIIEQRPTNLAKYGLDKPGTTVTINKNDGTSDMIFIGAKSPVKNNYFVKTSRSDMVYALSSYAMEILTKPVSYYTEFVRFSMEDTSAISKVSIERRDITISLTREKTVSRLPYDSWLLTSPIKTAASSDYISNSVLGNISKINLSMPLSEGDFGFDHPVAKLTLTVKPYNNEKQKYGEEYTEQFTIGKKSEGNIYVLYKDKAYSVPATYLEFVNSPLINMVMKLQSLVDITKVESVEVNYRSSSHILAITHSDEADSEMGFKLDGVNISTEKAKKFYQDLIGIQIDGIYNGEAMGKNIMSVKYKGYDDAQDINIEFKVINDLECAFVKNGETQFTVKKSTIEALMNKIG